MRYDFKLNNFGYRIAKCVIFSLLFLLFVSCVYDRAENRRITLINKSNKEVFWLLSESGHLKEPIYNDDIDSINANSTTTIGCITPSWDELIERSKEKKVSIFIIYKDSVDKYGWKLIYKKQIYATKFLIDMETLDRNKWTIEYK